MGPVTVGCVGAVGTGVVLEIGCGTKVLTNGFAELLLTLGFKSLQTPLQQQQQ